ncbi:MAG: hypothetical protein GXO18_04915 [Aquificae bacterium]|nr:hypothetical protein [Aquificota bacterium]
MNLFKAIALSFYDLIRQNYAYHSGALTYQFLLSIAPLTIVLVNALSLMPVIDLDRIIETVDRILPQYTNKVVHEILALQKKSGQVSFIALGLSYFFSVGFIKNLGKAFYFVSEGLLGQKREFLYWLLMPVLLLVFILVMSAFFFLSLYMKFVIPKTYTFVSDLLYVLPGALILMVLYGSFLTRRVSPYKLMFVSFFVSVLIFLIQWVFTWYVANIFKGSLLYGSLSTVVAFLIWANLIFLMIVLGARLIYRLENS